MSSSSPSSSHQRVRRSGGVFLLAALIPALCILLTLFAKANAQQALLILTAPATPYQTDLPPPPPAPSDDQRYPLPQNPQPAFGEVNFQINFYPDGIRPSIPIPPNMLGLSIELSVADEFLGDDISAPAYQLLNYLGAIGKRAGRGPVVRIGGNTQDTAFYNTTYPGILGKIGGGYTDKGTPITPKLEYSNVIFTLIHNIASMVDARIVWGVNMVNSTADFTVKMVSDIRATIGDSLEMLLVGNEPDRYTLTGNRPKEYGIPQYIDEWGELTQRIIDNDYPDNPKQFVAPSVCCAWTTAQVMDGGLRDRYINRIRAISAIKYPQSMCSNNSPYGHAGYLNQSAVEEFSLYDNDAVAAAVAANIPYWLTETNTASCIGVPGVSDAFTAAIWATNMALQMAYRNHSGVLLHSGGSRTLYNVFTPPSFNSTTREWRTGPVFYSTLVLAEALRPTDDATLSTVRHIPFGQTLATAYGIYENEVPTKIVIVNMANDASGANNMNVKIPAPSDGSGSLSYKLLTAPSVQSRDNITWAGQTFGYYSEGVLTGTEDIRTAQCNDGQCVVNVPAPAVALVFLTTPAKTQAASVSTATYAPQGTADPKLVLDSNGSRGDRGGSTSRGSVKNSAVSAVLLGCGWSFVALGAAVIFALVR